MNAILSALLSVSVYASLLLGAILLLRLVLHQRLSPKLQYLLWSLFVLRLLVPVTFESGLHLPSLLPQPAAVVTVSAPAAAPALAAQTGGFTIPAAAPAEAEGSVPAVQAAPEPAVQPAAPFPWRTVIFAVYLAGVAVTAGVFLVSRARFSRRLRAANVVPAPGTREIFADCRQKALCPGQVRLCVTRLAVSPMLLPCRGRGLVVLPDALQSSPGELRYAILHELTHFRRGDHLMCLLLAALRCVYWFHPLVWLGLSEMTADMETACDADVLCTLLPGEKRAYLTTLLALFTNKTQPLPAMAQAQTRRLAEKRMKGAFMKPRSGFWTVLLTVVLAAVLLLTCFTTACQSAPAKPQSQQPILPAATPLPATDDAAAPAAAQSVATPIPASYAFAPAVVTAASDAEVQVTSGTGKTHVFRIVDKGQRADADAPLRGKVISAAEAAASAAQALVTIFGDVVGDETLYVYAWNSATLTGERYNVSVGGDALSDTERYTVSIDAETGMVLDANSVLRGEQKQEVFDNFDWETQDLTQISSDVMAFATSFIRSCYPTGEILFDSENLADASFVDGIQVVGVGDYLLACDAKIRMDEGPCYLVQVYYPQMEIAWFASYPLGWDSCCMMEQWPEQLEADLDFTPDEGDRTPMNEAELTVFAAAAREGVGSAWALDPAQDGKDAFQSSYRYVTEVLHRFAERFSTSHVRLETLDSPLLVPGSILFLETDDDAGRRAGVYVGDGKYVMADPAEGKVVERDLAADFGTRFPRVQVSEAILVPRSGDNPANFGEGVTYVPVPTSFS